MAALEIAPLGSAPNVDLALPGSKSITNRCLLAAGLSTGRSRLSRVLLADDTEAMIDCIEALGARVVLDRAASTAEVLGNAGAIPPTGTAFARQSGTTARFIAPILALATDSWWLDGDPQLRARPMSDLFVALRSLGVNVVAAGGSSLPAEIRGPFQGDLVAVSGETSSQFLSGLLQAGALTKGGLAIEVTGQLVSRPYVEMTIATMQRFGAEIQVGEDTYSVAPTGFRSAELAIEPDASTASYFFAAAALTAGRVRVLDLGTSSVQGDLGFARVLQSMGANLVEEDDFTEIRGQGELRGIEINCADFSDTVPTLAVVAAFADGPTRISGVGFIRSKESDRIAAVVAELRRCGIDATEEDDGLTVNPGLPHGSLIRTYGDHRIAMAFSVMGLVVPGIIIDDPDCVGKTFPDFFATLDQLRSR